MANHLKYLYQKLIGNNKLVCDLFEEIVFFERRLLLRTARSVEGDCRAESNW
jgi:hypothetical protein